MKKSGVVIFSAFFILLSVFFLVGLGLDTSTSHTSLDSGDYVPHELLVKLKEESLGNIAQSKWLIRNIIDQVSGKIRTYLHEEKDTFDWDPEVFNNRSFHADPYLFHIKVPEGIDLDHAISRLRANPYVEFVERNGIVRLNTDDPYYDQQWALYNPTYSGRDIHAEAAWAISTGNSEIIVAVIDTGIDYDHEDLQGNLWTNPNETDDDEDNDHNGFVDDLIGWNFVDGNSDPLDDNIYRPTGEDCLLEYPYHGTHCSGVIGAIGNNGKAISGICWNIKLMPLKTHGACGGASVDAIVNAIDYATKNGAWLTSNSYSVGSYYESLKAAINRATAKNRLFIASAGNSTSSGVDIDEYPKYPASYELTNIISVLATTISDEKRETSNYGQDSVDIGAPGENIVSLKLGDTVQSLSGTSMAVPHVAGVAALALGLCPGLTHDRLKDLILDGADYVSDLNNKCVSEGRLNAYNVLNSLEGTTSPTAPSNLVAYSKSWLNIEVRWNDNSNNEMGFEIQRKDQYQSTYLHENCKDINSNTYAYFQDSVDASAQRTYTYRVRAVNKAGISSFTNTSSASIPYTTPSALTNLYGQSPVLEQNVNITWSNQTTNALYVYVERTVYGEDNWEVIATLAYNADSYSDNDAQAGNTYQYRVRAGNPIGYSSYSNTITVEVIDW